jgi:hypothetical protein
MVALFSAGRRALLTAALACLGSAFAPAAPWPNLQTDGSDAALAAVPNPTWRGWDEIYAWLGRRADAGERDAARLALEMHRAGPRVYGRDFRATPQQLQRWQCRAQGVEPPCESPARAG